MDSKLAQELKNYWDALPDETKEAIDKGAQRIIEQYGGADIKFHRSANGEITITVEPSQ